MEIIDFRIRPRTAFFLQGISPDPIPEFQRYIQRYKATVGEGRLAITTLEESTRDMLSQGVTRAVITGSDARSNEEVYKAIQAFPHVYIGLAGIDIHQGHSKGVEDLEKAYTEYGLAGLNVSPYLSGVYADDERYHPLYDLSDKMGKTVTIHSSLHYNPKSVMELGNPRYVDQVAVDFPNLRIVMAHAGSGFGMAAAWIADRHKNVYLDFSALHPRYTDPMMAQAINTILRDKAIYGSGFPCLHFDIFKEWRHVVQEANMKRFLCDNVLKALRMD